MYNHNTMLSNDARYTYQYKRSFHLCLLAASLCANHGVDGFGIAPNAPPSVKKNRALEISSYLPHPSTEESLADRLFRGDLAMLPSPQPTKLDTILPPTKASHRQSSSSQDDLVLDEEEVYRRKLEWAGRYTSVEALRETFGANENKLWGDLQASTARRLYKTLLPRALLELSQLGVGQLQPQDLAPLAYQARVAAKLYARERCTVPARLGATLFDGFRQWMKYGKFQAHGMTYDQLWQKYAEKICQETEHPHDAAEKTCLKILERSCVSNSGVDALVLKNNGRPTAQHQDLQQQQQQRLLERIHSQLEQDMYQLLLPHDVVLTAGTSKSKSTSTTPRPRRPWSRRNHVLMVRLLARQRRLQQRRQQQQQDDQEVLKP